MAFERHHSALIVASLVTVVAFVGATIYTQARLAQLDSLSATLETNAIPSIEYLSSAAVRLTRLNQLLDAATAAGTQRAMAIDSARAEVDALSAEVTRYLQLPPLPGEHALWNDLRGDVTRALPLVRSALFHDSRTALLAQPDDAGATTVHAALDTAIRAVLATLEFDVRQSQTMARDVRAVRASTLREIVGLDALATSIAVIGLFVAYRASHRHDELAREHSALLADRVTELDRFAGRMAHDVLSPLGTVATALALVGRTCDEGSKTYIARSQNALQRVRELVEGLLMFARTGARPDPAARCSLDAVFARVAIDCSEAAVSSGIDLTVSPVPPVLVPCAIGVMASVVENLVRNSIKYMGTSAHRHIAVRAVMMDRTVRIEVEDTGPGIPAELHEPIFEPFFRGPDHGATGTGLGLATVKRLADSHGGAVGVRSTVGSGSVFWVELPIASPSHHAETHATSPTTV